MVKQPTHNRSSLCSIHSWPTKQSGVSIMDNAWDFYSQNRGSIPLRRTKYASMGELVDPADLKSAAVRRTGSTPVARTKG